MFFACACGGDDDPEVQADAAAPDAAVQAGICEEANSLCGTIEVSSDFSGTTASLLVALYSALPPAGPPDAVGGTIPMPVIGTDTPFELELADISATGDYFVYVSLYMEGGGTFVPVPGVDYIGQSASALTFDGTAVDIGTLTLNLAPAP